MYCELPFYHFYIDGNWVKPCCYNTEMYQSNSDFNDISLVEFRREMLSGVIPDSCGECKIKEDAGVTSYRQYNQELNPNPIYEHENGVMKMPLHDKQRNKKSTRPSKFASRNARKKSMKIA